MEEKKNYNASVTRHNVTVDEIRTFVKDNIVKFVFLDRQYSDLTSDDTVNEIHKFKSKYRGNTYVRIPLRANKTDDWKYVKGIVVEDDEEKAEGFVLVSKHDLRGLSKEMKKASKEECVEYGKKLCKERLEMLNSMLNNSILEITIKDNNNVVVGSKFIPAGMGVSRMSEEVSKAISEIVLK